MAITQVFRNFSESEAHCHAVVVLPSLTKEPPPVLGGIH